MCTAGVLLAAFGPAVAAEPTPRADHHQHLFSPGTSSLSPAVPRTDAARLVGFMDEAGIPQAVVLSVAYQFGNPNRPPVPEEYARVRDENDWTATQVARFPARLRGFCSVNPLRDYAVAEVERCAALAQMRGLKLHFGNSDVDLLSAEHRRRVRDVVRVANARVSRSVCDASVYLH
jgi:predicted TIM-barrel fold metal-dependent hydrolase